MKQITVTCFIALIFLIGCSATAPDPPLAAARVFPLR
jgi:hypothetical protein